MSSSDTSLKAIIYALLANLGIALSKTAGAVFTGSGSMLAESIHSFADCANQLLLMIGLSESRRKPDREHPLGHGMVIFFWSFIVAVMLFSMGGVFSVYEGIHKLTHQEPLAHAWLGIAILSVSIILETGSLMGALREVRKLRGDRTFFSWLRETRKAELVVVLGEDTAAIAGLAFALAALTASYLTGDPLYDSLGSIAIGAILITVAIFIGARIRSLLIGESAGNEVEKAIRELVLADKCVSGILNLITIQMGDDIMLSMKCRLRNDRMTVKKAIEETNRLEAKIKSSFPRVRWSFFEIDNRD